MEQLGAVVVVKKKLTVNDEEERVRGGGLEEGVVSLEQHGMGR